MPCLAMGGGIAPDGSRWVAGRPGFFLPVKPLAQIFRRLFLERLAKAFAADDLGYFGDLAPLANPAAFAAQLAVMGRTDWVVIVLEARLRHDAKKPFGGPAQVLAYLGRYTHRVAIANSRLIALDETRVAFTWKDYRSDGVAKVMRLKPEEFIRRLLLHVLPDGFHRIRSFGFMANGHRTANLARCRALLEGPAEDVKTQAPSRPASDMAGKAPFIPACPHCGGVMHVVGSVPRSFHQSRPRAPHFTGVAT